MKKQNNIRRFISFLLCLVMAVSTFSVFSFAEDGEEDIAVHDMRCPYCQGETKWLPIAPYTETDVHYYTAIVDGIEQSVPCIITNEYRGECLVCASRTCGAYLVDNVYITSSTHGSCGL